jgi:hypothetical protein
MSPEIILAIIVLAPIALLMFLRANAALVFLSLCLGNVLVEFISPDANSFLALFSAHVPRGIDTGDSTIKLVLLLLPVILTTVFMIRTVHDVGRLILNILPAAGVGLLGGLLVVPLLPAGVSNDIISSSLWSQAQRAQDLIVGGSALVCLLVLWLQRPKTGGHKHGKHGKG